MNACKEKGNVCRMGCRWIEQVAGIDGIFCYVYVLITRISGSEENWENMIIHGRGFC